MELSFSKGEPINCSACGRKMGFQLDFSGLQVDVGTEFYPEFEAGKIYYVCCACLLRAVRVPFSVGKLEWAEQRELSDRLATNS